MPNSTTTHKTDLFQRNIRPSHRPTCHKSKCECILAAAPSYEAFPDVYNSQKSTIVVNTSVSLMLKVFTHPACLSCLYKDIRKSKTVHVSAICYRYRYTRSVITPVQSFISDQTPPPPPPPSRSLSGVRSKYVPFVETVGGNRIVFRNPKGTRFPHSAVYGVRYLYEFTPSNESCRCQS
jgi:hypothetical protein